MSLHKEFWQATPCWKGHLKQSPRDKVVVVGDEVRYFLWGSQIATWNKTQDTLRVDDCHWKTKLTFKRLDAILGERRLFIRKARGIKYLEDCICNVEYFWEGTHTIQLRSDNAKVGVEIYPCRPRRVNVAVSYALRRFYADAYELIHDRKMLITQTTEGGVVCLWPQQFCLRHFSQPILGLYVHNDDDELTVYCGSATCSKVYSAFMNPNNASSLAGYLAKNGWKLVGQTLFSNLSKFGVDLALLPQKIAQQLTILKLLET